jgi:hypothetical protein
MFIVIEDRFGDNDPMTHKCDTKEEVVTLYKECEFDGDTDHFEVFEVMKSGFKMVQTFTFDDEDDLPLGETTRRRHTVRNDDQPAETKPVVKDPWNATGAWTTEED